MVGLLNDDFKEEVKCAYPLNKLFRTHVFGTPSTTASTHMHTWYEHMILR